MKDNYKPRREKEKCDTCEYRDGYINLPPCSECIYARKFSFKEDK